jgi:hypothetical protein
MTLLHKKILSKLRCSETNLAESSKEIYSLKKKGCFASDEDNFSGTSNYLLLKEVSRE